jgi:hypothetical protein
MCVMKGASSAAERAPTQTYVSELPSHWARASERLLGDAVRTGGQVVGVLGHRLAFDVLPHLFRRHTTL